MRNLKVLLITLGLVFGGTQSAVAHAELVKSFPVANSTLTKAPKYVQLEFGEALTTLKSKSANTITIVDSKNHKISSRYQKGYRSYGVDWYFEAWSVHRQIPNRLG